MDGCKEVVNKESAALQHAAGTKIRRSACSRWNLTSRVPGCRMTERKSHFCSAAACCGRLLFESLQPRPSSVVLSVSISQWILMVEFPRDRVKRDVLADAVQFIFVADDAIP